MLFHFLLYSSILFMLLCLFSCTCTFYSTKKLYLILYHINVKMSSFSLNDFFNNNLNNRMHSTFLTYNLSYFFHFLLFIYYCNKKYKWIGHTHPRTTFECMMPSEADYNTLKLFKQKRSMVYNSVEEFH